MFSWLWVNYLGFHDSLTKRWYIQIWNLFFIYIYKSFYVSTLSKLMKALLHCAIKRKSLSINSSAKGLNYFNWLELKGLQARRVPKSKSSVTLAIYITLNNLKRSVALRRETRAWIKKTKIKRKSENLYSFVQSLIAELSLLITECKTSI